MLWPHELLTVSVPVVGGAVTVILPLTEYWLVAVLQAPGLAVNPVRLHNTAQLVVPVLDGSEAKFMVPAWPEKLVISSR